MMRKILFIIPDFNYGGTNSVLLSILPMIDSMELQASICSLNSQGPLKENFARISNLIRINKWVEFLVTGKVSLRVHAKLRKWFKFTMFQNLIFCIVSRKIERTFNPTVVVAFQEGIATSFTSRFKCKKVAWVHCDYKYYMKVGAPAMKSERCIYKKFDSINCVSEYTRASFCDVFPEYHDKTNSIYNPIDITRIKHLSEAPITDIGDHRGDSFYILSVGRYCQVKQFDFIPKIVQDIVKYTSKPFIWYILGSGDTSLIEATKHSARLYGIEDKIVLLGFKDNPYPYIKNADLLVITSSSEACPCVINEAKLLDTFVVANDFPSAKELVDDKFGIIANISDMPQVISKLIKEKRIINGGSGERFLRPFNASMISKIIATLDI